jgi:hypothetical protein
MYIVGQEETVGESSVSVVAGVRTVTTNMDGRDALPRLSRPFAFLIKSKSEPGAIARAIVPGFAVRLFQPSLSVARFRKLQ